MIKLEDIYSLTDFQRDTKAHIKHLKKTGRPAVLTINGKAELLVQDAAAYQEILDTIDRGEGAPIAPAFRRVAKKYRIRGE